MSKSPMRYLGFLSLMSLLYFVDGSAGFLGFLGFLPYFSMYSMTDERVERSIGKGSRNAFLFTTFAGSLSIAFIYLTRSAELFPAAFTLLFSGTLLAGIISILYYDRTGK